MWRFQHEWHPLTFAMVLVLLHKCCWCHISSSHIPTSSHQQSITNQKDSPLDFQFHVAPMQGYTNLSFREFLRGISPDCVLWTEMEKVPDLLDADSRALERRFGTPGPRKDCVLQVGGNDPSDVRKCIRKLSSHGYTFREINLNCGCPSIETGGSSLFGARLMKDPQLTSEILRAIRDKAEDETVVSLKCRTCVYEDIDEMLETQDPCATYRRLVKYVSEAERAGISHLVLHARPVILSGLSPTKNRQVPPIDYSIVEMLARDFPSLDVTLNGGITTLPHLQNRLLVHESMPSINSFMAGRWILRRPLDLAMLQLGMTGAPQVDTKSTARTLAIEGIKKYSKFLLASAAQTRSSDISLSLDELCLPLFLVAEQVREDYEVGEDGKSELWLDYDTMERIFDAIADTSQQLQDMRNAKSTEFSSSSMQFNRLSNCFKTLVGKKVANKWKRNRSEL